MTVCRKPSVSQSVSHEQKKPRKTAVLKWIFRKSWIIFFNYFNRLRVDFTPTQ
jgi:hypothetical protein